MEMEFKDNSRRRTLVLVVGVLLALGAGAAAFMLSSQGTEEAAPTVPLRDVVVAAGPIEARSTIQQDQVVVRQIPLDASNALAFSQVADVAGKIAAIPIYQDQAILPEHARRRPTASAPWRSWSPTRPSRPTRPTCARSA